MAPWLADRLWLQVLLVSVYCGGFTIAGRWAARQRYDSESPAEHAFAVTMFALFGGLILPLAAAPIGLCWLITRLLSAGNHD